jgi:GNAT superfamily N-acetyltransferase
VERIRAAGYSVLLTPAPSSQIVEAVDLVDGVETVLTDVRATLREHGRNQAAWFISASSRPPDLRQHLSGLGPQPADEPPWEPRYAAMVLTEPPDPGTPGVPARRPASFEEYDAAHQLEEEIAGLGDEDRRAAAKHRRTAWDVHESDRATMHVYVAVLGGEIVGVGRALLADAAINLSGGAVRPDMRGRGIYRALVRARWDAAVERGTLALTVQAGRMSRPILEGLGFEVVAEQQCLIDRFR